MGSIYKQPFHVSELAYPWRIKSVFSQKLYLYRQKSLFPYPASNMRTKPEIRWLPPNKWTYRQTAKKGLL